jgi:hypothetical protein
MKRTDLLREVRMTHQSHPHVGIQFLPVIFTERDNINAIEGGNQAADNSVKARRFVRQLPVRRRRNLTRLSTNNGLARRTNSNERGCSHCDRPERHGTLLVSFGRARRLRSCSSVVAPCHPGATLRDLSPNS